MDENILPIKLTQRAPASICRLRCQLPPPPPPLLLLLSLQLVRAMREHPEICRDRVLSEIGILFVEGFETTGGSISLSTKIYQLKTSEFRSKA
jgi:hypothetical protein